MPGIVTLEVTEGPLAGKSFAFEHHDTFLFGRDEDCHAVLSPDDVTASRHHFLLEVNPPDARLRDLGSRNGTWVNELKYGGRGGEETPDEAARRRFPEIDIHDGDRIAVGGTRFIVHCRNRRQEAGETVVASAVRCDRCGRELAGTAGKRPGAALCAECRKLADADPLGVVTHLATGDGTPDVQGFVVGDFLAKGGQGAVYRARRVADGREVAFKVMLAKVAVDERSRKLFEREIEVARSLRHPNIVELLDHGSAGIGFYFAMELCRGGSADAVMQRRRAAFTLAEAGPLILQALDGLAFAHARKYVHRDLKPPNILLGNDERGPAKIADFGLAKSFEMAGLSGFSATGTSHGTLIFMPREQLTHYKYARPGTDVWSMAATLYYMLCGQSPRDFGDRDPVRVILDGPIVSISQRGVTLPPRVGEVLDCALAPRVEDRYQDAAAFRDALSGALGTN